MARLNKIRVEQTSALQWDVYLNDEKVNGVRSLRLDMKPNTIPSATIEFLLDESCIVTECVTTGVANIDIGGNNHGKPKEQ